MKKRVRPKPAEVVVRRIGSAEPVEVVAPDELIRRKEEAEWQRWRRSHGLDLRDEHARLALKLGDTVTVPSYTGDLWWFVRDVNGVDRTITGATFIFKQPFERTFPFEMVEPRRLWHAAERNDAAAQWQRVQQRFGSARRTGRSSASAA